MPSVITAQRYQQLPEAFYQPATPMPMPEASLLAVNEALISELGLPLDWFNSTSGLAALSGQATPTQAVLAMAYAGHQFGHWSGVLGDGRAHLLGQVQSSSGWLDMQTKGSGPTPFSRGGDGRATLASVLREYLVSEAMAGLNIASTRSLAMLSAGDAIMRNGPEPAGILLRSAKSHIRVGTFEYAARIVGGNAVQALADFVIAEYFPTLQDEANPYLALLAEVASRQAQLIAKWMLVGFIHGVMNTDNMSIVGETIDYGPCAFMDEFHPNKVFSSIDRNGRYAWGQQARIGQWNLSRFAETLLPYLATEPEQAKTQAMAVLDSYLSEFEAAFQAGMCDKLGLPSSLAQDQLGSFIEQTLKVMSDNQVDYSLFFSELTQHAAGGAASPLLDLFAQQSNGEAWLNEWQRLRKQGAKPAEEGLALMQSSNPQVIARNHQVAAAISAATEQQNLQPFKQLCQALAKPYELSAAKQALRLAPRPEQRVRETFCGT